MELLRCDPETNEGKKNLLIFFVSLNFSSRKIIILGEEIWEKILV